MEKLVAAIVLFVVSCVSCTSTRCEEPSIGDDDIESQAMSIRDAVNSDETLSVKDRDHLLRVIGFGVRLAIPISEPSLLEQEMRNWPWEIDA